MNGKGGIETEQREVRLQCSLNKHLSKLHRHLGKVLSQGERPGLYAPLTTGNVWHTTVQTRWDHGPEAFSSAKSVPKMNTEGSGGNNPSSRTIKVFSTKGASGQPRPSAFSLT